MIDAHQHFWRLDRGDYGWLTASLAPIYRDFGPADLAPLLARHGIDRTVLVQAAPTEAETEYLLGIASATPWVAGVVGWTDFESPQAPRRIAALARHAKLVGLRPMVQDLPDDHWLARADLVPAFEAMIGHGLVFDALVMPRHLPALAWLLERHPSLTVVVDHGAKPRIREGELAPWYAAMREIARHDRVYCKLSGLVTEASPDAPNEVVFPFIDALLDVFGARRLLWGSDWPVVNLAGGYDRWRAITLRALARVDEASRAAVLGDNAASVYLDPRGRSFANRGYRPGP